jgi:hypothetical protein
MLFGKLQRGTLISGHFVSPRLTKAVSKVRQVSPKFKSDDWQCWLDVVKNFCKKSTHEIDVLPLFLNRNHNDNRPHVAIKMFDRVVTALLDSGSNLSIIGRNGLWLLDYFKLQPSKSAYAHVFSAAGNKQSVEGSVNVLVSVEGYSKALTFLVVPSLPHSFILGSDFCYAFDVNIDFKTHSWTVQGNIVNSPLQWRSTRADLPKCFMLESAELSDQEKTQVDVFITSLKEVDSSSRLGRTDKLSLDIDTGSAKPFKQRQFPMSPYVLEALNKEIDEMLELDVIEPSQSPWCSNVLLVNKKNGEKRFCFDGRKLNEITKHDSYPLPRVDRILSLLRDAKFISSIDLRKAFWQIPLHPEAKEKTAFAIPGRGLFQFKVVPFGLCNSAQAQQRLMDAVFGPKYEPYIFVYLDDIIIVSSTFEKHLALLYEVKERLKEANLTINFKKCEFFKSSLNYLGFIVDGNGIRTDPAKIETMVNYPRPTTVTELKIFGYLLVV